MSIDPRAVIEPGAKLAPDVVVGPYAIIGAHVEIGPGCRIGPHSVVTGWTRLGANNQIFQFASIGDAPQDKKYAGEPTRLEIGDRNVFREYVTVNRGTTHDEGVTRIGHDNLFMAYTHVAHDCRIGNHVVMANVATLAGHVEIGDHVIMGGLSAVHQFCKIGAHAFIANNTAVTRDVPPYVMAVGQPAEPHSVNATGLSRRGFTPEQVRNVKSAFRTLYRSELPLETALERLRESAATQPEVAAMVDFIGRSTRSLVR
ncbi:MAG: acyl-ACP--UDP-N-acetylglucosamine O-acyltransferase [Gammaproteobacteria bacterium]|jgi:UDP-N-acetylglucosamine acyltransferase|nr:acyl-ACP--UDP-N-acetylglucosamine O-acyltransferase [Gammaproteobacteria bacterium]